MNNRPRTPIAEALERIFRAKFIVCETCGHKMDFLEFEKKRGCSRCINMKLIQGGKSGSHNRRVS